MILINEEEHSNYNCIAELSDGQQIKVYANWLHNQGHDHWKNWQCLTGSRRIYVDASLNIYNGECANDFLGTIDNWKILEQPTVCKRNTCTGCTDDLMTTKWKIDN